LNGENPYDINQVKDLLHVLLRMYVILKAIHQRQRLSRDLGNTFKQHTWIGLRYSRLCASLAWNHHPLLNQSWGGEFRWHHQVTSLSNRLSMKGLANTPFNVSL
jgi:hypothetical protein